MSRYRANIRSLVLRPSLSAAKMLPTSRRKRTRMSKAGQIVENLVTGERVAVRVGTEDCAGELLVVDAYVRRGRHRRACPSGHRGAFHGGSRAGGLPPQGARYHRAARPTPARAGRDGVRLVERRGGRGAHHG